MFDLGAWLGRKQAFTLIAGRCSAATVVCLRKIREGKRYRALGLTWEEFCRQRAGVSRAFADKVIQQLEQLGPAYFELSSVTRITPDQFRQIAGAVTEEGLSYAGEPIEIIPENAPMLAQAIEILTSPPAPNSCRDPRANLCQSRAFLALRPGRPGAPGRDAPGHRRPGEALIHPGRRPEHARADFAVSEGVRHSWGRSSACPFTGVRGKSATGCETPKPDINRISAFRSMSLKWTKTDCSISHDRRFRYD